jgi:hypothetical protein
MYNLIFISWWKSIFVEEAHLCGGSADNLQFLSRNVTVAKRVSYIRKYEYYIPVIKSPAVRCDVGEPAKEVAPRVAPVEFLLYIIYLFKTWSSENSPPRVHATPPSATKATRNLSGGQLNH